MMICNLTALLEFFGPMLGFFAVAPWMISAWFGRLTLSYQTIESTMGATINERSKKE
jgi:hypothetical protein